MNLIYFLTDQIYHWTLEPNDRKKNIRPKEQQTESNESYSKRTIYSLFEVIILINGGIWFRFWVVKFNWFVLYYIYIYLVSYERTFVIGNYFCFFAHLQTSYRTFKHDVQTSLKKKTQQHWDAKFTWMHTNTSLFLLLLVRSHYQLLHTRW